MAQRYFLVYLIIIVAFITGCSTTRQPKTSAPGSINRLWDSLGFASKFYAGLSIYDPKKDKYVFNHREDNFFTPASNIKLLTMYASLQYLDEFVPAAYYQVRGDTMVVWGGGDPGTKYPSIIAESPLINFLKATDKTIVFSDQHFHSQRFGDGWAWDDYRFPFQPERTAFPVYGNKLWVERYKDSIVLTPRYFNLVFSSKKDTLQKLTRNEWGTQYYYQYDYRIPVSVSTVPVSLYENDIRFIWKEATGKDIFFKDYSFIRNAIRLDGTKRDTLLKWMMQESDNFVAEQLLLSCALSQTGSMNEKNIIRKMLVGPLAKLPDSISWVDGSGLSRYNLLTPRSVIWILDKLLDQKGLEYMKVIFPAGGMSGTIRDLFKSDDRQPYIFAKTGTLRHNYCVSGILITRTGRVLLFSWMNNQFNKDAPNIKTSMDIFFKYLRDHY